MSEAIEYPKMVYKNPENPQESESCIVKSREEEEAAESRGFHCVDKKSSAKSVEEAVESAPIESSQEESSSEESSSEEESHEEEIDLSSLKVDELREMLQEDFDKSEEELKGLKKAELIELIEELSSEESE